MSYMHCVLISCYDVYYTLCSTKKYDFLKRSVVYLFVYCWTNNIPNLKFNNF